MGSCTAKSLRSGNDNKSCQVAEGKTSRYDNDHFSNPEVRAKIFKVKDSKTPVLKIETNLLRIRRLSTKNEILPSEV